MTHTKVTREGEKNVFEGLPPSDWSVDIFLIKDWWSRTQPPGVMPSWNHVLGLSKKASLPHGEEASNHHDSKISGFRAYLKVPALGFLDDRLKYEHQINLFLPKSLLVCSLWQQKLNRDTCILSSLASKMHSEGRDRDARACSLRQATNTAYCDRRCKRLPNQEKLCSYWEFTQKYRK